MVTSSHTAVWAVAIQPAPQDPIKWEVLKLSGNESLSLRAAKKLRTEELLLSSFAPTRLRMELDRLLNHPGICVGQLISVEATGVASLASCRQ